MPRDPRPSPAEAAAFLTQRFGDVREIVRLQGGEWSTAFGFSAGGQDLVARFGQHAEDYAKDRSASAWSRPDLPIPRVIELGDAFGRSFAVSERVRGVALDALVAGEWAKILPALFRGLDALRQVELPGSGFGSWRAADHCAPHPRWHDFLLSLATRDDPRILGWRDALATVPAAAAAFDASCERFAQLVAACPEIRGIVHADLLAGNVLVDGERLAGVFDWGNSLAGDPLYDVAWLVFWSPWHPGLDPSRLLAMARERFDGPRFEERLRCYLVHIGLDAQQYDAFTGRWSDLNDAAARTRAILGP